MDKRTREEEDLGEPGYVMLKTDVRKSSMVIFGCLRDLEGAETVYMTGGDWSFVVKVVDDAEKYGRMARRIPGVEEVRVARVGVEWRVRK